MRPTVVLAMVPYFTADQFTAAHFARLEAVAEVPEREPLTVFGDARAAGLLARAEVLLTGWGCPPLDAAMLAAAPRLRALVHAACSAATASCARSASGRPRRPTSATIAR